MAAGLVLAAISRVFVELTARRKATRAQDVLEKAIGRVSQQRIIDPVNAELRRYEQARDTIAQAR